LKEMELEKSNNKDVEQPLRPDKSFGTQLAGTTMQVARQALRARICRSSECSTDASRRGI